MTTKKDLILKRLMEKKNKTIRLRIGKNDSNKNRRGQKVAMGKVLKVVMVAEVKVEKGLKEQ